MIFRKATQGDLPGVVQIYDDTHTELEAGRLTIGWVRSLYPNAVTAREALARDDLFVAEDNGEIVGTAILNQKQEAVYEGINWSYDAPPEQVMVLHTLAISPKHFGKGYGSRFVKFYEEYARSRGCRYLRLDANGINVKARKLYSNLGYREVGDAPCVFEGIPGIHLIMLEKTLEE